jgi:hypothetical protein
MTHTKRLWLAPAPHWAPAEDKAPSPCGAIEMQPGQT